MTALTTEGKVGGACSEKERREMDEPRVLFGFRPELVRDPEFVTELSEADIQEFAEMTVPFSGCGCGCGGSCGNELERDDGAEGDGDMGDPAYKVTSGQIDSLIVWLKEFGQERRGESKAMKDGEELATALSTHDDQWLYGKMTEKQAEAFFEACGYL